MLVEQFHEFARCEGIAAWYRKVLGIKLNQNSAFIQLGWGTGWDGKTFWSHLQQDEKFFEKIVKDYSMHRATRNSPRRQPGDDFPRSRRVAMNLETQKPVAPFGWVLFELEPKR